jgi:hypothetical protein
MTLVKRLPLAIRSRLALIAITLTDALGGRTAAPTTTAANGYCLAHCNGYPRKACLPYQGH